MCGIVGVYAFNEEAKTHFANVPKALKKLSLRGPDKQQHIQIKNMCMGHTRLAVIDLSEQAQQPMTDPTGQYTIIFNGEIYNYKELRKHLINKGVSFKTQSDTEVLLQLYIHEGEQFVEKLNGFFAFAIYNHIADSLFVVRDRMGIKPLLYFYNNNKLFFASEMKALLELGVDKEIDHTSVHEYFRFNYIPSPNTIFKNVKKLIPGTCLSIKNGTIDVKKYYTIPYNQQQTNVKSYEQSQKHLRKLIEESVKKRLIADVPLGSFLSGGIDSSVVVAEAVKHTPHLNTFSIGYKDEPFFDETSYAELVAKKFKTNHHTFKLTNEQLYNNLHSVLNYIDEPFADSSALPLHILSMHTRQHATVALSGDGADEMFAGYNKHKAHFLAIQKSIKSEFIKAGLPIWTSLPKSRNGKISNKIRQLEKYAQGLKLNPESRYLQWASLMIPQQASALCKQSLPTNYTDRQRINTCHFADNENINDILYADMHLVLVSDMLHKVDSMSMANSLEVRTPFLDHNIVEFAFSLPQKYKITKDIKKRILQDAYRSVLPAELYKRPKHGFEVPLLKWFRTELKTEINEKYLNRDFIESQNMFNYKIIANMQKQLFSNNPGDIQAHLWALVVFQHWWKNYMV